MHAAIGLMMGMYLFAMVMIVLNLAAFAPDLSIFSQSFAARLAQKPLRYKLITPGLAMLALTPVTLANMRTEPTSED